MSFDGNTDAMRAVELAIDGIDATLQDLPIVTFYEGGFQQLRRVGEPVGPGYYVILRAARGRGTVRALNAAIWRLLATAVCAPCCDDTDCGTPRSDGAACSPTSPATST